MASPIKETNLNKSGRNTYPSSEKRFCVEIQLTSCFQGKSYYTIVWDWFVFPAYAFKIKLNSLVIFLLSNCVEKQKSLLTFSWPNS